MATSGIEYAEPGTARRTRPQFTLRALVVVMVLAGIGMGVAVYYRRQPVTFSYQFATLDAKTVNSLTGESSWQPVPNSSYSYLVLPADRAQQLVDQDGALADKTRRVTNWPKVAETTTYSVPIQVLLDADAKHYHTDWQSGSFGGFLGSRRAGTELQLRIEGDASFRRPVQSDPPELRYGQQRIRGKLFYEGAAPEGALLFVAPLDESTYHAVVFNFDEES